MFDSHCHLDFPEFDADRDQVLANCRALGMRGIIVPAIQQSYWSRLLKLTDSEAMLYPALGLHPMLIDQHHESHLQDLNQLLSQQKAIAVGEIGLDYFLAQLDKHKQQFFFVEQLRLAKRHQLPVILHVRKAHDEVLMQLRRAQLKGGIVHAFSGSEQQAYQYIDLGFKLGFGGALTYERAKKLRRLAASLPLESIVLETDAPDMPLANQSGRRNSPENTVLICKKLAQLRASDEAEIALKTQLNTTQIFSISQ